MSDKEKYFDITNNFKNYPLQPFDGSDDVVCYGVPTDEGGLSIMPVFEAAAFASSNDMVSLIALRIPHDEWLKLNELDPKEMKFNIKDEYYIDYKGQITI